MPNGDTGGGGFDFSGIFDSLLGGLAGIIQAIIDFLNSLVSALVQILNFLFAGEVAILGFSAGGLTDVFKGLKNILDQVFKVSVVGALKHLLSLYQKLQRWIAKLKMWLDRLRKIQQLQQAQALRRVINLIQRIRKVLVVLRILHVKFAAKLDNWLAGIEGKLIRRTFELQRKTNEIIGWLDLVLDPRALFRAGSYFGTVRRGLTGVLGAAQAIGLQKLFPQLVSNPGGTTRTLTWSQWSSQFTAESATDSGYTGEYVRSAEDLRARITAELGT